MTRDARGTVLLLGATSGIGRHIAAAFARRGHDLLVTGRDAEEAERVAADLELRHGVSALAGAFDARDTGSHADFFRHALEAADGRLVGAVIAFGLLGEQEASERDFEEARTVIDVNFTGAVSILTLLAGHLAGQRDGFIVAISSVAGDRGRQSNYTYGSAKGALAIYLQGLRNRLHRSGVRVVTVKPGFVDTGMTYGLPGMFLMGSPARAGEAVARAVERGRDVVYIPWFWRWVMLIIRLVPERVFKRLRL
jgi:decaprenylphospho-beta-D-erythro-pentofuranosid-2-ulose 2-reductase